MATVTAMGISSTIISDRLNVSPSAKNDLLWHAEWRRMLSTDIYRENLVAFVINEAHCIKKWYVFSSLVVWAYMRGNIYMQG